MKLFIHRSYLEISIQTEQDKAYCEDTLGLHKDGDAIFLVRRDSRTLPGVFLTTRQLPEESLDTVLRNASLQTGT